MMRRRAESVDPRQLTGRGTGLSTQLDTDRMMRYDANRKSALLAYILWFFLGWFGLHRMYLGRVGSGIAMLVLHGLSWLTHFILIGFVGFAILGLWWLIDALLIPGMTRSYNNRLVDELQRRPDRY
jgi:TM2 domain-containing membrane protein YozV